MKDTPIPKALVAIKCLVFNHEPYLRDCLDGFVMQQTDFPFVAVVHDDASTDHSADIIREYAAKYPDIILPIYETANQYSKGDGSLGRIMNATVDATGAKYVAMCEGDDYWTDPHKLQKQVDFLESHPDYSMCFHGAIVKDEFECGEEYDCTHIEERDYEINELFTHWIVPTASIVYRNREVSAYRIIHQEWMITGDVRLVATCASVGKVHGFSAIMSVYRLNPNSLVHSKAHALNLINKSPKHYLSFYKSFPLLDKDTITWCLAHAYYIRARKSNENIIKRCADIIRSLYYNPDILFDKIKNTVLSR